jgi:hypothetical protein
MAVAKSAAYSWSGEHRFYVPGTRRRDDTLYIEVSPGDPEQILQLRLPTLCITYADLAFANAVGGEQATYPASRSYGPRYFDPTVKIQGGPDIEKFTWIRGAEEVEIGPETTTIRWYRGKTLVVPRLRIGPREEAPAVLAGSNVAIPVEQPLIVDVTQLTDGRPIGGIRFEVRHPDWTPPPEPTEYDLWVQVIDGETGDPLPETRLNLLRWDPELRTPRGLGGFTRLKQLITDGQGVCHVPNLRSEELDAITLDLIGRRAVARCYRAQPGQPVRLQIPAWKLREDEVRFTWNAVDTLEGIAALCGHEPREILARNRLREASDLTAGMQIRLPCYAAAYHLAEGDTPAWLAEQFGYGDVETLAVVLGVGDPADLDLDRDIPLPGWHFFYARPGDSLDRIDALFGLPSGASRPVGRVHHPDPGVPFESETIAVPNKKFGKFQMLSVGPS